MKNNLSSDQWNEKKGANELSKKLRPNFLQVIINLEEFKNPDLNSEDSERMFPRLVYLRQDESLIQAHLDIFEYFKPLFTLYLENKEGVSRNSYKLFKKRRNVAIPDRINSGLWNSKMTLNQ